jgi:hypothetical protein
VFVSAKLIHFVYTYFVSLQFPVFGDHQREKRKQKEIKKEREREREREREKERKKNDHSTVQSCFNRKLKNSNKLERENINIIFVEKNLQTLSFQIFIRHSC